MRAKNTFGVFVIKDMDRNFLFIDIYDIRKVFGIKQNWSVIKISGVFGNKSKWQPSRRSCCSISSILKVLRIKYLIKY